MLHWKRGNIFYKNGEKIERVHQSNLSIAAIFIFSCIKNCLFRQKRVWENIASNMFYQKQELMNQKVIVGCCVEYQFSFSYINEQKVSFFVCCSE